MIAVTHFIAVLFYFGAVALAATPFVRPVKPPVRGVVLMLSTGALVHVLALAGAARAIGQVPLTGLGSGLSFAGLALVITLIIVEALAREVTLTLAATPLAAIATLAASILGLQPSLGLAGARGAWLVAHIALSFVGIAAFATAAAAGVMYLVERRELKSRRFGAVFRFFPPLETLDRVNHVAVIAGFLVLTLGVVLAVTYSVAYRRLDVPQMIWGLGAWLGVTAVAVGRMVGGWQARRAALVSSVTFAFVVALYVAFRVASADVTAFL